MIRIRSSLPLAILTLAFTVSITAQAQEQERLTAIAKQKQALETQIQQFGGLDKITETLEPFKKDVINALNTGKNINGRIEVADKRYNSGLNRAALNDWPALTVKPPKTSPIDVVIEFNRLLKQQGVDLILVPVPAKVEAYQEDFSDDLPDGIPISVERTKVMLQLLDAGVEVVDVLPTFRQVQKEEGLASYELHGHHPSGVAVRAAADLIAERLQRYDLTNRDLTQFKEEKKQTTERTDRSVPMWAWEVQTPDGKPYQHVDNAEVVVTGDSTAFAYFTASWASHIARATGVAISDLSISDGGPLAPHRVTELGLASVQQRKVVIWIYLAPSMAFTNWEMPTLPEQPTLIGLIGLGKTEAAQQQLATMNPVELASSQLNERELIDLGHNYLDTQKNEAGMAILKLNAELFPYSATALGAYGYGFIRVGQMEKGKETIEKAMTLFPSRQTLSRLEPVLKQFNIDQTPPARPALTKDQIDKVVGKYESSYGVGAELSEEDGKIYYTLRGTSKLEVFPVTDNVFNSPQGTLLHVFDYDGKRFLDVSYQNQRSLSSRQLE